MEFLKKEVTKAVAELGKGSTVHVLKGEKKLLPKLDAAVVEDLQGLGGAMVEGADGKIRMDLTLETLFDSRRDEIRKHISEKLFGGE